MAFSPAEIGPLPSLTTSMSGQFTTMDAWLELLPVAASFVAATVTVLGMELQSAGMEVLLTVIVRLPPSRTVPKVQVSRFVPLIEQSAAFAPPSVQAPEGSWSLSVTPYASPGPALLSTIVNVAT